MATKIPAFLSNKNSAIGRSLARKNKYFKQNQPVGSIPEQTQFRTNPIINPRSFNPNLFYPEQKQQIPLPESISPSLPMSPLVSSSTSPSQQTLPENYGFNELAAYEEARRNALGKNFNQEILGLRGGIQSEYDKALQAYRDESARRRSTLASSLSSTGQQTFDLQNPGILEDLNSRGVFSSPTAIAQAQAQALKEIALANQGQLNQFDTSTRGYEDTLANQRLSELNQLQSAGTSADIQAQQDALDSALDLRRGLLEKNTKDEQASREEALARDLARQQGKNNMTTSLIGVGGNILGAGLAPGGFLSGSSAGKGILNTPVSGLFNSGSALAGVPLAGGGGAPASSLFPNGLGPVGTGTPASALGRLTVGKALGGAGAGYVGSRLGRRAFGGGNDLGGTLGSTTGFLVGGPVGAGIGGFLGTGAQRFWENADYEITRHLGNTAGSLLRPITNPVGVVKNVVGHPKRALKHLGSGISHVGSQIGHALGFCFEANTPITMDDGNQRPISHLYIGASTKGGKVISIRTSMSPGGTRFLYKGIEVTGSHAVNEDKRWIRVKDSPHANLQPGQGIVWSLVTEKHRIWINGIEFADEHETDDYEYLSIDQSLNKLNQKELAEVA